ncbi:capsular exopolysaccharide synthesis family protein [Pacificibacter maritimus]|uniref:Capsular exopolysaccharide synthesis family protein n=1 Tax=Pacificibacter maritimus TaxID=762213 RepID=A0A3N4TYM9_9RHOB|nr:GNVR domain-containing protein [Pacificibacter maritimus]RPE62928.1 capsular exopolysaccharide synthesis family protein [Pacificibacter maritimus]
MTDTQDFIDPRDVIALLRRQLRLIAVVTAIFVALAFIYVTQATPLYTASALLKIDPQETNILNPTQTGNTNSSIESTRLETEVEILKSSSLAIKTIEKLNLVSSSEFGPSISLTDKFKAALGFDLPPTPSQDALMNASIRRVKDAMSVRRRGLTYIVSVDVTTSDPKLSADVANAHAQTYIEDQISGRSDVSIASRDVLQSQLETARQSLSASNNSLREYISENLTRLAEESGNATLLQIGEQLQALGQPSETYTTAQIALETQDWQSLAQAVGDNAMMSIESQRQALLARLGTAEAGSDQAFDLTSGLERLEEQLKQRGAQAVANLDNSEQARFALLDDAQNAVLESELSAATLTDIYSLQQDAQIAQRQYDQLLSRIRDLETQAVLQVANSRVVSQALVPNGPSFPNKKLTLALALILGLGIGIGIALLKEFYFGGITSAHQLENVLPVKIAGAIPNLPNAEVGESLADRVITEPMSPFAEAYRKLRASIDEELDEVEGSKVILVTSALAAEGKSTSALALARTYFTAGKSVLLIDADLRNPSLHKFFNATPESGLIDYLIAQNKPKAANGDDVDADATTLNQFYVLDPLCNLGVIIGHKKPNVPTDAPLQSTAFIKMLKQARKSFDIIIVDSAPLLPVVDTRYIAPHVDAAVMCVRYGVPSQSEVRSASEQLMSASRGRAKTMAVLSCSESKSRTYGYDGYYGA